MTPLFTALVLIPTIDQAVKAVMRRRLGTRSIPLGVLGRIQIVQGKIWMTRAPRAPGLSVMWAIWIAGASALALVTAIVPSAGWAGGAVLGASFSHALETSLRGSVCDYVCLRFWPAFNLADTALTVGGGMLLLELSRALIA